MGQAEKQNITLRAKSWAWRDTSGGIRPGGGGWDEASLQGNRAGSNWGQWEYWVCRGPGPWLQSRPPGSCWDPTPEILTLLMKGGSWACVSQTVTSDDSTVTEWGAGSRTGGPDLGLGGRIPAWGAGSQLGGPDLSLGGWTHKGFLEEVMSHHTGCLLSLVPKPETVVLLGHRGPES